MKILSRKVTFAVAAVALAYSAYGGAHETDDPLLAHIMIDQLEWRSADESDPYVLAAQGWIGKDMNKLWIKTDVEHADGATEDVEIQALYSRAIAPFGDVQVGLRQDLEPDPTAHGACLAYRVWRRISSRWMRPCLWQLGRYRRAPIRRV